MIVQSLVPSPRLEVQSIGRGLGRERLSLVSKPGF